MLAGGITTIGNMTFALPGESMTQAVARDMAGARAEAAVDWFLHPVLTGLGQAEPAEVATLAADGRREGPSGENTGQGYFPVRWHR